jgi:hypothetical protein
VAKLQVGFIPIEGGHYYQDALEEVVRAEELGFASVWMEEHHSVVNHYWPSPITVLAGEGPADAFRLDEVKGVAVVPARASGVKCARSWRFFDPATADPAYPDVTPRDGQALRRLRTLAEFRRSSDEQLLESAARVRWRDCLTLIAAEFGFPNWPQAKNTLTGEGVITDFGDLLCPRKCAGHFNNWYAKYEEAAAVRETSRGYLLAFSRQYVVVDRYYIEELGLDPDDAGWVAMGYDWARPKSVAARTRLYNQLVAGLPRAAA